MLFKVDEAVFDKHKDLCIGVVVAEGMECNAAPRISRMLAEQVEVEKKSLNDEVIKKLSAPYHEVMKAFGINPSKYPSSFEALLKRISKGDGIPDISPTVNLGNYISIKYKLPVGAHDIGSLSSEGLSVRFSGEKEEKNTENSLQGDVVRTGELVYVSGNSVRTRRWIWRQMEAGKVEGNPDKLIFPIDGFEGNKDAVAKACNELAALLEDTFSATVRIGMLDAENPKIKLGELSEEEKQIENAIKVILKGVADHTPVSEIRAKLVKAKGERRPLRVKLGLDPSAPDIHIGHSVVLRKIRQIQDLGHHAVIIIGDYTGRIGDPSGKSKTRKTLTEEDILRNAKTYEKQIFKVLNRDKTEVRFNSEWLDKMNFGDVIDLASRCTVARMLERDDFHNRYVNHLPLSVHEFLYPLMQGYDSVAITADIELGGTDQTFNILMGRNIQRSYGMDAQLTIFMPLLEGLDGVEKMSKSLGNYIGIDEEPHVIYEKVMKIPDSLIIKYYNLCTDEHPDEVAKVQKRLDGGENPRDVKMELAFIITSLYCGEKAASEAQERFVTIFQKEEVPEDVPVIKINKGSSVSQGEQIMQTLLEMNVFKSKGEIKRIFQQNGAKLDGETVNDVTALAMSRDESILKIGKNRIFKITI